MWRTRTYKFGLLLQGHVHPLLPEVKKVHDGTENSQGPLLLCREEQDEHPGYLTSSSSQVTDVYIYIYIYVSLLGARRSFSEKSYTKHMGRNCRLKEITHSDETNSSHFVALKVQRLVLSSAPLIQTFAAFFSHQ